MLLPAVLAGCTGQRVSFPQPPATELASVPFYPQEEYQCGPAALATVLGWSGAEVDMETLVSRVYVPDRQGSLQPEIVAAARRAGRIPYPVPPSPTAIGAELAAGHPVLVLQNLGVDMLPRWHYAVVVGFDPVEDVYILRSGTEKTRRESVQRFMSSWQRGDYWGVVVLEPGQVPASQPLPRPVVRALARAEGFLSAQAASTAWEGLLERWPDDPDALFGAANALRRAGNEAAAGQAYRKLLQHDPGHVAARNNLADLMLDAGCRGRAHDLLEGIREADLPAPLAAAVSETRRQIGNVSGPRIEAAHCGRRWGAVPLGSPPQHR